LATRSPRQADPDLIWPVPAATVKSAIVVSSVSPRAVGDYRRVAVPPCQLNTLEGFRHRPNLIQLDENRVRDAFFNALLEDLRVGHEDVVSDQLDLGT
jgi:hypothetical protein